MKLLLLFLSIVGSCSCKDFNGFKGQPKEQSAERSPVVVSDDVKEDSSEIEVLVDEVLWSSEFKVPKCEVNSQTGQCFVVDPVLDELSGLSSSGKNKGVFWAHNDGGTASIYGLNLKGEVLARVDLVGATNLDFEDIALYRKDNKTYLYQGDIGDKDKEDSAVILYRFEEPAIDITVPMQIITVENYQRIELSYDSALGVLDFESMMIDPLQGDLYLFEKGSHRVFVAAGNLLMSGNASIAMNLVTDKGDWSETPSGADFSSTRREFVIRDELNAWLYNVTEGEAVSDALKRPGQVLAMAKEFNGEAIAYGFDGVHLYTASENLQGDQEPADPQPIMMYERVLKIATPQSK